MRKLSLTPKTFDAIWGMFNTIVVFLTLDVRIKKTFYNT
jgi:hypothetical protein